jgi:hypothetical protein
VKRLRPAAVPAFVFGLALLWVAAGVGTPEFRADSPGYLANLRSPLFDGDLDLRNEFESWGRRPPPPTAGGHPGNAYTWGPALLWAPFFVLAHLYVLLAGAVGLSGHAADGLSATSGRRISERSAWRSWGPGSWPA